MRHCDGALPTVPQAGDDMVQLPAELRSPTQSLQHLADNISGDMADHLGDAEWLQQRAILTPLNADVDRVNSIVPARLPTAERLYMSVDTVEDDVAVPLPTEVLNVAEISGMPCHQLRLKVGATVVIRRNMDAPAW